MRAMFGLVGLLVTIGVIVWWMSVNHPADTVRMAQPAKQQAERLAGVDSAGMRVQDSITLDPVNGTNGKLQYVLVDDIVVGGPMETHFKLRRNDSIIAVGPIEFRDIDGDLAKAMILEARARNQKLMVLRGGQKIELPPDPSAPQPAPAGPSAQPGVPVPPPPNQDSRSTLQRQLDALPGTR